MVVQRVPQAITGPPAIGVGQPPKLRGVKGVRHSLRDLAQRCHLELRDRGGGKGSVGGRLRHPAVALPRLRLGPPSPAGGRLPQGGGGLWFRSGLTCVCPVGSAAPPVALDHHEGAAARARR